jgi:hypothetical protein
MFNRRTWIILISDAVVIAITGRLLYKAWNFIPFHSQKDLWVGTGWLALLLALGIIGAILASWSEHN